MELNIIMDWLSNQAFSIIMCVALFWKMNKQDSDHKTEVMSLVKAIDNNTLVLTELLAAIRRGED